VKENVTLKLLTYVFLYFRRMNPYSSSPGSFSPGFVDSLAEDSIVGGVIAVFLNWT
jgi:hypothetical protein